MNEAESWIENRYEDENGSEDRERKRVSVLVRGYMHISDLS